MRLTDFHPEPDLIGRRIRVTWTWNLTGAETLADLPAWRLRRKTRDYDFDFPVPPGPDPFLVFDSSVPLSPDAVDLPGWETTDSETAERTITQVVSLPVPLVSPSGAARPVETLRLTETTVYDSVGLPLRRTVALLDAGLPPDGLQPGTTYYYRLQANGKVYDGTATANEVYGLNRTLYNLLPAIYRRHDVVRRPVWPGAEAVPEASPDAGQLRRFLDVFGLALDRMRGGAEGLRGLTDINETDAKFLPLLADLVGWRFTSDSDIALQRNELKSAARLYQAVGTIPTLRGVITRYTGWNSLIVEWGQSLSRANQPAQLRLFSLNVTQAAGVTVLRRDASDTAPLLGFTDTVPAVGGVGLPANIVGTQAEPFMLHSGMTLTVRTDEGMNESVVFEAGDFQNTGAATAAEVAGAIRLPSVEAVADAGRVRLRTRARGTSVSLVVAPSPWQAVALESAVAGRAAAIVDMDGRARLLFEVHAPVSQNAGDGRRRLLLKTQTADVWGDARALPPHDDVSEIHVPLVQAGLESGSPALALLADNRLLAMYVESPDRATGRVCVLRGTTAAPTAARLSGQRRGPFTIPTTLRLSIRGDWEGPEDITLVPSDFPDPNAATAVQVAALITSRSTRARATVAPSGALFLDTQGKGAQARLRFDLARSIRLDALGFSATPRANVIAHGTWDDTVTWDGPPTAIPTLSTGRYADLYAQTDSTGVTYVFAAQFSDIDHHWRIVGTRWNGTSWSPMDVIADAPGGCREPFAARASDGRLHLFWSRGEGAFPGEPNTGRSLRRRIWDPVAGTWDAEFAITTVAAGSAREDREPGAIADGTDIRVFFTSNRDATGTGIGGDSIYELTIPDGGAPGEVHPVAVGAERNVAPVPLRLADGTLLLMLRSDRSETPASRHDAPPDENRFDANDSPRSYRLTSTGTTRRYAGTVSALPNHLERNQRKGRWDDLNNYTILRPLGPSRDPVPLTNDDYYTRGTIGVFLRRGTRETTLTDAAADRLRALLPEFLPINARAVVLIEPSDIIEMVYGDGVGDIGESYEDRYPLLEVLAPSLADESAASLPDVSILHANTLGEVSADPAVPTTLRRRTYFSPPE